MPRFRSLSLSFYTLLASLWFLVFNNTAFWHHLLEINGGLNAGNALFLGSVGVFALVFINLVLTLLVFRRVGKWVLALLFIIAAFASYFMNQYGVMIDSDMVQNVFETDPREAGELISLDMAGYFLVLGLLPAFLFFRIPLKARPLWKELLFKLAVFGLSGLVIAGIALGFSQNYASMLRNHKEIRYLLAPVNFLQATSSYLGKKFQSPTVVKPLGEDAKKSASWQAGGKPTVLVLVVGETARAANFSLAGYGRDTNPELKKQDIVYFTDVHSCGTATAVSLPCMFSNLGRDHYSEAKAKSQQGLLDVLSHAGFQVLWDDNNSGCKGACDRVQHRKTDSERPAGLCRPDECYDDKLVDDLDKQLADLKGDWVIVLHQKGSHGPAYYLRYPQAYEVFKPVCRSNQMEKCSREEIVNAYDNTIRYTDHVLAAIIETLKARAGQIDGAMLYVSDHGESLGENNLYLHGAPYLIAPEEQKHVPMIYWQSAGFGERFGVDAGCLENHRGEAYSHDNLFHSVLGLMSVSTSVYNPELDLFGRCRKTGS